MEYNYSASTGEAKAGALLSSGQPGTHTQTFSKAEQKRKERKERRRKTGKEGGKEERGREKR